MVIGFPIHARPNHHSSKSPGSSRSPGRSCAVGAGRLRFVRTRRGGVDTPVVRSAGEPAVDRHHRHPGTRRLGGRAVRGRTDRLVASQRHSQRHLGVAEPGGARGPAGTVDRPRSDPQRRPAARRNPAGRRTPVPEPRRRRLPRRQRTRAGARDRRRRPRLPRADPDLARDRQRHRRRHPGRRDLLPALQLGARLRPPGDGRRCGHGRRLRHVGAAAQLVVGDVRPPDRDAVESLHRPGDRRRADRHRARGLGAVDRGMERVARRQPRRPRAQHAKPGSTGRTAATRIRATTMSTAFRSCSRATSTVATPR